MGFRTIKENEQVLIFNRQGSARQVSGPRRVSFQLSLPKLSNYKHGLCFQLWLGTYEKLEYMPRYVASQDQYLIVQHRDGRKEHITG